MYMYLRQPVILSGMAAKVRMASKGYMLNESIEYYTKHWYSTWRYMCFYKGMCFNSNKLRPSESVESVVKTRCRNFCKSFISREYKAWEGVKIAVKCIMMSIGWWILSICRLSVRPESGLKMPWKSIVILNRDVHFVKGRVRDAGCEREVAFTVRTAFTSQVLVVRQACRTGLDFIQLWLIQIGMLVHTEF